LSEFLEKEMDIPEFFCFFLRTKYEQVLPILNDSIRICVEDLCAIYQNLIANPIHEANPYILELEKYVV
jgi:hypothetical protein